MRITKAYSDVVKRDGLTPDSAQQRVVETLQVLQNCLEARPSLAQRLLGRTRPPLECKGVYLWGGVGRGKTFLMDLFYNSLHVTLKRRIHFHRMMREIHERRRRIGDVEQPLDRVAAEIAADTRVLCFDEFFVSDIGDAMVLARLLQGLFRHGVTLVTTSNSPPHALYPGGLQREQFLPAIALLEQLTNVVELDNAVDYRLQLMRQAGTYLSPADDAARQKLKHFFIQVAPGDTEEARTLDILGRQVRTLRCAKGVAWFDFGMICGGPRSQNDYIELARWYQTIIVSDIPLLDRNLENEARRFISLVDEFYDRRVKLVVSAAVGVDRLYQGSRLEFEFRRTASRLTEMQSEQYLHEAHIA